jgi:peptide/nickel transport system substrate-binding protein
MNMKKLLSLVMAVMLLVGTMAGFTALAEDEIVKEAPMLAEKVAAGELPALEERLPSAADVYVEEEYSPVGETPVYGGTLRTNNGGMWYYGPFAEEPLFRLLDDGTVEANVAKGYDLSEDGLVYTIYLREGMKWSDGTPFTATDCVYYYNYVLVTDVDNETGKVTKSNAGRYYNWYQTADPNDGNKMKPAQVRYVDDTTFTITLYSPKPTLLQAICIDNKWMFCPKEWYKDIMVNDASAAHWTGETDLKLIGGENLPTITEEEAVANALKKSALYNFENAAKLGDQLGYRYWQYAGRPTLRPWNITNALTDQNLIFERNPYYWKVDAQGRQLPYIDTVVFVSMDANLYAQEKIAGNLDLTRFDSADFPIYKMSEAIGNYTVYTEVAPNWTSSNIQFNQGYRDLQYRALFADINFRHAISIAADREELNEILYNGMLQPAQFAAPKGTGDYVEGAPEKWIEYDPDAANALLDQVEGISKDRNADGYRTFVGGEHDGQAVTIEVETCADSSTDSQLAALLAKYYKVIGLQIVESSNTDNNARNEKYYTGDVYMASVGGGGGSFNIMLRPDAVAANRNNCAFVGKFGLEHADALTPEPGSPMEELVNATKALVSASKLEELQAAAQRIAQSHFENTWVVGFLISAETYDAVSNRVHNFREGFVNCDELRFLGYAKPYTWFLQD